MRHMLGWVLLLVSHALLGVEAQLQPGDAAPPIQLPVLDGGPPFTTRLGRTTLFCIVDLSNPAHRWSMANAWSLQTFLQLAPFDGVDYVFLPLTGTRAVAEQQAKLWYDRMLHTMRQLSLPLDTQETRLHQLFFIPCSASDCAPWLAGVAHQWSVPGAQLTANVLTQEGVWQLTAGRMDAWYDWVPRPDDTTTVWCVYVPDACTPLHATIQPLADRWVLAPNSTRCRYADMARNVQRAGGMGLLVQASRGKDVELMMPTNVDLNLTATENLASIFVKHGASNARDEAGDDPDDNDITIPLTQISFEDGQTLKQMMDRMVPGGYWTLGQRRTDATAEDDAGVLMRFENPPMPVDSVGIDSSGRLIELGWVKVPTLMHLGWQAQYQVYLDRLAAKAAAEPAELSISIVQQASLAGEHGVTVWRQLPLDTHAAPYTRVLVDMQLSCQGTRDTDCPQWDHMVQMFACCEESCSACPITPWRQAGSSTDTDRSDGAGAQHAQRTGKPAPTGYGDGWNRAPQCGFELARWCTPFRRRSGHWVTDVTPLLPLLKPGVCSFTVQAPPWADAAWMATISLNFSHWQPALPTLGRTQYSSFLPPSSAGLPAGQPSTSPSPQASLPPVHWAPYGMLGSSWQARRHAQRLREGGDAFNQLQAIVTEAAQLEAEWRSLVPFVTFPLFQGGMFDKTYNDRAPRLVPTPRGSVRAIIMAVISGHGSDDNNCAEFCPTSHHFAVNGSMRSVAFNTAGTTWGCTLAVPDGALPNEHGTWFYGRDGWCDGQQVQPWLADVTDAVAPPGGTNNITYVGYYKGRTPDPAPGSQPGEIMMASYITFFARHRPS